MKKPQTIQEALEIRGVKSILKRICQEACVYPRASGKRDSWETFGENGRCLLRISRDSSWRDDFEIALEVGDDDGDMIEVDSFRFQTISAAEAYDFIRAFA